LGGGRNDPRIPVIHNASVSKWGRGRGKATINAFKEWISALERQIRPWSPAAPALTGGYTISPVAPSEYGAVATTLWELSRNEADRLESDGLSDDEWLSRYSVGMAFAWIAREITTPDHSSHLLAVFIAKNNQNEILGAYVLLSPQFIPELGLRAVTGATVVRIEDQRNGIGTALRHEVLLWLKAERYEFFAGLTQKDPSWNPDNLEKVARQLGIDVERRETANGKQIWQILHLTNAGKVADLAAPDDGGIFTGALLGVLGVGPFLAKMPHHIVILAVAGMAVLTAAFGVWHSRTVLRRFSLWSA